jgi:glycosyltransferase involved in cell wall biosynthesis
MSREIRNEFVAAGVAPERVALIPHGVDTERFRPASPEQRDALRRRLALSSAGFLITYTGRLLRGKGLEALVDAFATLAAADPRAHLVLVGSGAGQTLSVEDELRARVERQELTPRVTFSGRVDNVEEWLRASDVFAFPSVFEALGISLVEAAACGLPCVASRTGGIVDVVEDGVSGLLVDPGHTENLAAALRALAADAMLREKMGKRGRAIALARFAARDGVERYRALFVEVTARCGVAATVAGSAARGRATAGAKGEGP